MYTNLKKEMAAKGITIDAMARLLNIHRNTLANKVQGESEFTFEEACLIADTFFPEYRPTYLFHH